MCWSLRCHKTLWEVNGVHLMDHKLNASFLEWKVWTLFLLGMHLWCLSFSLLGVLFFFRSPPAHGGLAFHHEFCYIQRGIKQSYSLWAGNRSKAAIGGVQNSCCKTRYCTVRNPESSGSVEGYNLKFQRIAVLVCGRRAGFEARSTLETSKVFQVRESKLPLSNTFSRCLHRSRAMLVRTSDRCFLACHGLGKKNATHNSQLGRRK